MDVKANKVVPCSGTAAHLEALNMKILLLADKVSPALYDYFEPERFAGIEMVISCGDLPAGYLDFIASMLNVPCYYVPGNHDGAFLTRPPAGWRSLDGRIVLHQGITLAGLGGCLQYNGGPYQYSEFEMRQRVFRLRSLLWWQKCGLDILVTHAPAYRLGDLEDRPHRGVRAFREILDLYTPRYFLHGHVHLNYGQMSRTRQYGETRIINGFEHHIFDF